MPFSISAQNNLLELIKTRRTIHRFKKDKVEKIILDEALSLLQFSPNHHLTQTGRFYQVGAQTKKTLLEIAARNFKLKNPTNADIKIARWENTPHWIMVTQVIKNDDDDIVDAKQQTEDYATISMGLYAMMLYLAAKGIGSKWATGNIIFSDEWLQACKINPDSEKVIGLFWVGYPELIPEMPPRFAIDHYVTKLD